MAGGLDIRTKRAYDPPDAGDGRRFLVDRLWPRGVTKEALAVEAWRKDAAPSNDLRRRFGHKPEQWDAFQAAYAAELDAHPQAWAPLLEAARAGRITLVFAARDTERNNAVALKVYLERQAAPRPG